MRHCSNLNVRRVIVRAQMNSKVVSLGLRGARGLRLWAPVIVLLLPGRVLDAALPAQEPVPRSKGYVWFQTGFEEPDARQGWSGPVRFEPGWQSAQALAIENRPGSGTQSVLVSRPLPAERVRGCMVRGSAMVRAQEVSARPNAWNGVKCMLAIETPERRAWPQAAIETATFDWQRAAFTTRIPTDATAVRLVLGLEQVTGKVWFDDVKIAVVRGPVTPPALARAGARFKGHNLPRLRGAMISPDIDAEGLRVLGQAWNANLIRWQLIHRGRPGQRASLADYDAWLEGELKKLDAALPLCERYGLYVVVDLHSPPGGKATSGGYTGSDGGLFSDPACQAKFVEVWRRIATRYKNAKPVWGYDLANEPVEDYVEEGCDDWPALAERAARAIRAVDPERAIIVEPADWGGPDALSDFVPLPVSNVVYSVHMYQPHAFTHQNVYRQDPPLRYPGIIQGKHWDKAQLEAALLPVVRFQTNWNVHIYIGEFSAIRWAPDNSAWRYLKDLIDIFEAHGWDWSYHAFREWHGWSVEHGPDRANTAPVPAPTDRQRLLCDWFAKNQKPRW